MGEFKRLIAFGCSMTHGHSLPDQGNLWDTISVQEVPPSKLAWPAIVGKELNLPVFNQGIIGASNKEIAHTALEFDFKQDDLVIVMWSSPYRTCVLHNDRYNDSYFANGDMKFERIFFKTASDFDLFTTDAMYQHLVDLHVKSYNNKIYHTEMRYISGREYPNWLKGNKLPSIDPYLKDFALDGQHPGVRSHYDYGKALAELIKKDTSAPF